MRKRHALLRLAILALFAAPLTSCAEQEMPAAPRSVLPDQIAATIVALPRDVNFGISGLAFFKGRLYASTNVGLLVVSDAKPEALYKWVDGDDVIEGPWADVAGDALWLRHVHDNSLWRFDGSSWRRFEVPVPPEGFTRGDFLTGFLGIGSPTAFWLVGAGHLWRFEQGSGSWAEEPAPPAPSFSSIRAVAPGTAMRYIVQEGTGILPPFEYAVYSREDDWARQDLPTEADFGDIVTVGEGNYVRMQDGRLFSIRSGVQLMETPGRCEAIAQTSTGKLIVSFVDQGIFVFDNSKWALSVPYPYDKQEGDHRAYLAESGQIAYATSSVPQIQRDGRFKNSGSDALWVQVGTKLERVVLN